jgi:hypothetical protein
MLVLYLSGVRQLEVTSPLGAGGLAHVNQPVRVLRMAALPGYNYEPCTAQQPSIAAWAAASVGGHAAPLTAPASKRQQISHCHLEPG